MKPVFLSVELFTKGELFYARIEEKDSSIFECFGFTPNECAKQIIEYIKDKFVR